MGDRTYVTLTVLTAQADDARELFDDDAEEENTDGHITAFGFDGVNYATLGFESDLTDAGIAYDKRWNAGDEYGAGSEYVRFRPDGTVQHIEVYDEGANPDLGELMRRLDKPDELIQYIRNFHEQATPLPWENQIEYGNLYLAKQDQSATAES